MEMQKNNDRKYFEDFWESSRKVALLKRSLFSECLNIQSLQIPQRFAAIYSEFDSLLEERNVFDRHRYLIYADDTSVLFELFEEMGHLYCAEELAKLQQAMIISEKSKYLRETLLETITMEHAAHLKVREQKHRANGNNESDKEALKLSGPDPVKPSAGKKGMPFTLGYTGSVDIFTEVIKQLDDRIHFLDPRTSVEHFVHIFTCPDWRVITEKAYIACHTTEFKCAIDEIKKDCTCCSFSRIGRSELFVSTKGNVIQTSNLTSTNYQKTLTKDVIKNIFRKNGM